MNLPLRVPQAGDVVSATKFAALLREVRANRILPSPNLRISRGPNGTHLHFGAVRGGGGVAPGDLGCYRLEKSTNQDDEPVTIFGNQYYRFGNVLNQSSISTTVEDLLNDAGTADSSGVMPLFIALRLSAKPGNPTEDANGDPLPRIEGFGSLAALMQAQGDLDFHVLPLYLMDVIENSETGDRSFAVRCDFRRGVVAQQWEEFS